MTLPWLSLLAWWPYWTGNRYDIDPATYQGFGRFQVISHYAVWPDPQTPGALFQPSMKTPADPEATWPDPTLVTRVHGAGALAFLVIGGAETEPPKAGTGGGADEGFRQICGHHGTGALRQNFVDALGTFMAAQGYDGIDIDWEAPGFQHQFRVTGATNATPIVITAASNESTPELFPDFVNGGKVDVFNVVGNDGANGEDWVIANRTPLGGGVISFELAGSVGTGAPDFSDPVNFPYVTPGPEERNGLADLVTRLRTMIDALPGGQKYLTMTPLASDDNGHYMPIGDTPGQEALTLARLDWVAAQTYGLHGPWSGHAGHVGALHSTPGDDVHHFPYEPPHNDKNLSFDSTVRYWHNQRGIPKNKLWLGVGTYGYTAATAEDLYDLSTGDTWDDYRELRATGWHELWDDAAVAAYLLNDDGAGVISLPTPRSVDASVQYVADNLHPGIVVWSIGKDYYATTHGAAEPLLQALAQARHRIYNDNPRIRAWLDLNASGAPDDDPAKEISAYLGQWTDSLGGIDFQDGRPTPQEGTVTGFCTIQLLNEPGEGTTISPNIASGAFRALGAEWTGGSYHEAVEFTASAGTERRLSTLFMVDHDDIYDAAFATLVRTGTPVGTVRAEIWSATAAGIPQALPSQEYVSLEYDITDEVGTTPTEVRFRFPIPPALAQDTPYALVLITTGYTFTDGVTELAWRTGNTWDNFERTDPEASIGTITAPGGNPWVESAGNWGITAPGGDGMLYSVDDANDDRAIIQTNTYDGTLFAELRSNSYTTATVDLIFRAPVSPFFPALLFVELGFGTVYLAKSVEGVRTDLATAAQTLVDGTAYSVQVRFKGAAVEVRVGGVLKISYTFPATGMLTAGENALAIEGQTYAGFRIGGGGQAARFDTFISTQRSGFCSWDGTTWTQHLLGGAVPTDGLYRIEANGLQTGRMLWLTAEYHGESYEQWCGYLDEITLDVDGWVGQLSFVDRLERAGKETTNDIALAEDTRVDELIELVVESQLGLTADQHSIGTADQVVKYFYAEPNVDTRQLLEWLADAGAGKHWIAAAPSPIYQKYIFRGAQEDENHVPAVDEEWDLDDVGKRVEYQAATYQGAHNAVRVTVNPRRPGDPDEIMWTYPVEAGDGETFPPAPDNAKDFEAAFSAPVLSLVTPASGTDFTAGFDVDILGAGAHLRTIRVTAPAGGGTLEKLQVRGVALDPRHQYDLVRREDTLVAIQGLDELVINNPYVQTTEHAEWLRDETLRQTKRRWPEPDVERTNIFPSVLRIRVGDKVQIWLEDVAPESVYWVESRRVRIQGTTWEVVYRLRKPTEGNVLT